MSEFTDGLRELAEWFDAHPEVDEPTYKALSIYPPDDPEVIATVARAMGTARKVWEDQLLYIKKDFGGGVELSAAFSREAICKKVVKGYKMVPAVAEHVVPAQPERQVEIVEWECSEPSLLVPRT